MKKAHNIKSYSKKERETIRMYKILGVTTLSLVILIGVSLALFNEPNPSRTGQYTAEQLLHDHNGDGIPDHY